VTRTSTSTCVAGPMPSVHPDALNACNASTAASNSESAFTAEVLVEFGRNHTEGLGINERTRRSREGEARFTNPF
jgi:hypothetical protein